MELPERQYRPLLADTSENRTTKSYSTLASLIEKICHQDSVLLSVVPSSNKAQPRFLRLPEVLNLVGVTRSTLYRWMDAGTFPKQISVGGNTVVWVESAVTAWMEDQMASR
ncbi:helix-turn-helix transcriptional regulator [Synechococcus sp. N19]|uniref:helix-turn-helix transcriptional regulator n=1 Tax=Synechococcus sp. N19 TaxID=2575512 RepID=UPI00352F08A2